MSKKVKIKLPNGNLYEGEVKKGIPHGQGTLKAIGRHKSLISQYLKYDKLMASSVFDRTKPASYTEEEYSYKYVGSFENGKQYGYGVLTHYIDNDKSYKKHPKRFQKYLPKPRLTGKTITYKYEGEWKNNNYHGQGKLFIPGSGVPPSIYIGKWQNHKRHGKGTQLFGHPVFKRTVTGIWNKDKCHKGTLICQNKEFYFEYDGEFTRGRHTLYEPMGRGILKKIDKKFKIYSITKGKFLIGLRKGKCTVSYYKDHNFSKELLKMEGVFNDEQLNGKGTITNYKGERYSVEFIRNRIQVKGKKIDFNKMKEDYEKITRLDGKSWVRFDKERDFENYP